MTFPVLEDKNTNIPWRYQEAASLLLSGYEERRTTQRFLCQVAPNYFAHLKKKKKGNPSPQKK